MVEAIETNFVPGLIYNNKKEDAKKLARFKEPSWNNPVVRFLDGDLKDVISRRDGVWSTAEVASRMVNSLAAAKKKVPTYLQLVSLENSRQTEFASFAMHCYWEGEIQFGNLAGVKATESAWYDNKEIVNVAFDPSLTRYEELVEHALKVRCASTIYTRTPEQKKLAMKLAGDRAESIDPKQFGKPAKSSDQKYYLQGSPLRLLPLTKVQKVRVNSALGKRADVTEYLSQSQIQMAKWIQKNLEAKSIIAELSKANQSMELSRYFDFVSQKVKAEE